MSRFLPNLKRNAPHGRRGATVPLAMALLAVVCAIAAHLIVRSGSNPPITEGERKNNQITVVPNSASVHIRKASGPPRVNTGLHDVHGEPVTIACNTCHGNWTANADARVGQKLERFHQHLNGSHGSLTCVSCHNANDGYATLRRADGKSIPYPEVMQLCAQCHGTAYRDYQHGSHGGMNGYWDLSKGSRVRNNCIDCHDPHTPRYPLVMPVRGPNDRFLTPHAKGIGHE